MKCDNCEREATVHEVVVRNGIKVERHLCEQCAVSGGIAIPGAPGVVAQNVISAVGPLTIAGVRGPACLGCRLTFAEFRRGGLLGCPDCYGAFEEQLGPLIGRAHEGATHHLGKSPRRAKSIDVASAERREAERDQGLLRERVATLRRALDAAVKAEHYERAARLRDELRGLEPGASQA